MPHQGPPGIQAVFSAALRDHQAGRLEEAELGYRQVLQIDSRHADALHFLGVLTHQSGRNDVAVGLIGKAIAQNNRVPAFHNNLGNALKSMGRLEEAVDSYSRALSLKPDFVGALYNIGLTRQAQGNLAEAAAAYVRALALNPKHAEAHNNLGNTLQAQGKLQEALLSFRKALTVKPDYAEAYSNLGNVLRAQGKLAEAAAALEKALALKPHLAEAHVNLGIIFSDQGKWPEAVACCERALICKPEYAEALHYLGNARREQGQLEQAVASYERALALKPNYAAARLGLATAVIPIVAESGVNAHVSEDFTQALDDLAAWNRDNPGELGASVGSNQPFYLAYRPQNVRSLLCRYGEVVCEAATTHWRRKTDALRIAQPARQRIRVVAISGQVRHHPVWDVILRGIIAHIDRERFEVLLYHTVAVIDAETAWAEQHVDRFVQGPKSTEAWLDQIADDRPDVIFYPEVGMDPATGALSALHLAPLQVAAWGHPVTTGLPSMDVFLSGDLMEGPQAEQHYRERLVRLPGTGVCTKLEAVSAQPWGGAARRTGVVRFALCHQPTKFDPADDALLAQLARVAGPSEFWLASSETHPWATVKLRNRLAAAFRAEGLDPDASLRVMPWLPRAQFAGFLEEMDIYLDCPAFSGYTTAWQAIHRGLPIITLEGEFLRQRLAAGLLRQIGATEGIAESRQQYLETAIRWAQESRDRDTWSVRRETIRRLAPQADDNQAAIRGFEQALIHALQDKSPPPDL